MPEPILHKLASRLLGGFVCVQLIYLPLANVLQRVPRQVPPLPGEVFGRLQREGRATDSDALQAVVDGTGTACDRWMEATAQGQPWSLFAPRFGENGTFLTLEVRTATGPVELRSRFEPADADHYVRFDVTHYRLFYREESFALIYATWEPDSFATRGPEWADAIREYVETFKRTLPAYVRWRLDRDLPNTDVREVIVAVRVFPPKPLAASRPSPVTLPLARWSPDRPGEMAVYDPRTNGFAVEHPLRR